MRATCAALLPTLFVCTESWLKDVHQDNLLSIPGYNILRHDRPIRIGGGVALWLSNNIKFKELKSTLAKPTCIECIWTFFSSISILSLCIYIPPSVSSADATDIHNYIVLSCDYFSSTLKNHRVLLCGDFNQFNTDDICSALGLSNIVLSPTCGGSCLDKILISECLIASTTCSVGPPISNSDHNSVSATVNCKYSDSFIVANKVFDMRRRFVDPFISSINSLDFNNILNTDSSIDSKFKAFQDSIISCFKRFIPCTLVPTSVRDKPWITPLIKNLIHERWAAYRTRNFVKYRKLADLVKNNIVKAKLSWANRASNASDLWSKVHSVLGTNNVNPLSNLYCNSASPSCLVNSINDHLTSVFVPSYPVGRGNRHSTLHVGEMAIFSEAEVFEEFTKYPIKKASGIDEVPTILYKAIAPIISKPLCKLFNASLHTGSFPSCWKHAKVVPLPKCKNPTITDLRPISLLPVCSKIFEKLIYKHFRALFLDNFGMCQFGFRQHSSTCHALIALHDHITSHCDSISTSGIEIIAFDFSKAFDKLDHNIVINRLVTCNFPTYLIDWFSSYLSTRQQHVSLGTYDSYISNVSSRVPQGSVLGPALFALVVGSLKTMSSTTGLFIFADDIKISVPVKENQNNVIAEIDNIFTWSSSVKLTLNEQKTRKMQIRCSIIYNPTDLPWLINDVSCLKLLGVHFSNDLKWDNQIAYIRKVCHSRFYAIRVLKDVLCKTDLLNIYKLLVRSVIEYCAPLFIGLNNKNSHILDSIQSRCHNLICGFNRDCNCLEDLSLRRLQLATNLYTKAANNKSNMLHTLIPNKLGSTYRQPYSRTSRRLNSFIPFVTNAINVTLTRNQTLL